jgi:hypothetical protein
MSTSQVSGNITNAKLIYTQLDQNDVPYLYILMPS